MNRLFDHIPIIGKEIPGKITLSFLMLVFAGLMFYHEPSVHRLTCAFAMLFAFAGDISLNYERDHDKQTITDFVLGAIAFIAAHLLYCCSYLQKLGYYLMPYVNIGSIVAFCSLVVITLVLIYYKSRKDGFSKIFWFGILYLWITGLNYITISSYACSVKSVESIALLGGILFFASDLIIGLERFYGLKSKVARELVWWFYPIGQIIIIAMA